MRTYPLDIATSDLGGRHAGGDDIESLPPHARHVASWDVIRLAAAAVRSYLWELGGEQLRASGVARLEVDYLGELGAGPTDVDIAIVRIGNSSLSVGVVMRQNGRPTSSLKFVQVKKDYATQVSVPFTAAERAALDRELEPAAVEAS